MSPRASYDRGGGRHALAALAIANVRYWPTVAPHVRRELRRWRASAEALAEPTLRELAVGKLAREAFNAEVGATLATLAPAAERRRVSEAIVALELLFDYLDGRTELPSADPLAEGERLFTTMTAAVAEEPHALAEEAAADEAQARYSEARYLEELSGHARRRLLELPSAPAVLTSARAAAARCGAAQTQIHAASRYERARLEEWARAEGRDSGLSWREYAAGSASSVLAMHALIARAAAPDTTPEQARSLDRAYLAIGAVVTILDALADEREDADRGELGFTALFADRDELAVSLRELVREALARAEAAPDAAHHVMTLAGTAAYYTTHPGAQTDAARAIAADVRRQLAPTIWPALAVMRSWRLVKRARARAT